MNYGSLEKFLLKYHGPDAARKMVKEPEAMMHVESLNRMIDSGADGVKDFKKARKSKGIEAMEDILKQMGVR